MPLPTDIFPILDKGDRISIVPATSLKEEIALEHFGFTKEAYDFLMDQTALSNSTLLKLKDKLVNNPSSLTQEEILELQTNNLLYGMIYLSEDDVADFHEIYQPPPQPEEPAN